MRFQRFQKSGNLPVFYAVFAGCRFNNLDQLLVMGMAYFGKEVVNIVNIDTSKKPLDQTIIDSIITRGFKDMNGPVFFYIAFRINFRVVRTFREVTRLKDQCEQQAIDKMPDKEYSENILPGNGGK